MRGAKHLILPVETAARELDAKLLLAVHAVQRGMTVTLGVKALVNLAIHTLRRGVLMPPNFTRSSEKMVRIANQLGHRVAAWDEEGLVWLGEEIYRERRVSRTSLAGLDMVIAWGEEHANALRPVLEGLDTELVLAGSPRADLLRPDLRRLYAPRAQELRDEFGDFILINSNFGWLNHKLGHGTTPDGGRDLPALAERSRHSLAYLEHRLAIFNAIAQALPAMSRRFPQRRIVIRPHPSEGDTRWLQAAAGLPNVIVRYDSELVPWLMAAGHIVQNGCTTAVEAALLDRMAISYSPVPAQSGHEILQPARVSIEARTDEELLELLGTPGLTDNPSPTAKDALAHMVASASGPKSSERVVEALDRLLLHKHRGPGLWMRLRGIALSLKRRRKHRRTREALDSPRNPEYYSHVFPPTPASEIEARTAAFAAALGLRAPQVEELSDRMFRLRPAQ